MSADQSKAFERIVELLPDAHCSSPIKAIQFYCKNQLGFEVELRTRGNENGTSTVQVYFSDRFIEEFTHERPKYAREQACKKALQRLKNEKDLLNEIIGEFKG